MLLKASMTIMIKGTWSVEKSIETKELNQVHISEEDMALIKQGFYQVANGTSGLTTGKTVGRGASVPISAKTGTAETTVDGGKQAINTNAVAYAPSNNPKIAVAVVFHIIPIYKRRSVIPLRVTLLTYTIRNTP